jgi:hypothetical protein
MAKKYDEQDWVKSLLRLAVIFLTFVGILSGAVIFFFYYT